MAILLRQLALAPSVPCRVCRVYQVFRLRSVWTANGFSLPRSLCTATRASRNPGEPGFAVANEYSKKGRARIYRGSEISPLGRHSSDTIAAIVTSLGGQEGSVAIVRLSGSSAIAVTRRLFRPAGKTKHARRNFSEDSPWQPKSHHVQYGDLVDGCGSIVDEVLVVPMLAPRSYTREDVVEIQCHGGDICVRRILQLCLEEGARLAQPGEFTLRAFLNGRLDLAQAENVAQLISAKTSVAAETALAGLQGGFSSLVQTLRMECLEVLGDIEARLDFEDEMPTLDQREVLNKVCTVWERIQEALATARRGQLLQAGLQISTVNLQRIESKMYSFGQVSYVFVHTSVTSRWDISLARKRMEVLRNARESVPCAVGYCGTSCKPLACIHPLICKFLVGVLQVAIVGRPNVGKSSLLNAWSQSSKAIVTNVPGTTRDVVEAGIVVGGINVKLLDTAGIRETDDIVEVIGVQRSMAAARGSDIVIMVVSACNGWTDKDDDIFRALLQRHETEPVRLMPPSDAHNDNLAPRGQAPLILVINKVDEASAIAVAIPDYASQTFSKVVLTCALQSVGLHELESALLHLVGVGQVDSDGRQWAVNQRQGEQLVKAGAALQRVKDSAHDDFPLDMWTVDLKEAAIALGQISGDEVTEEVLSNIFSRFCIGK